MTSLDKETGRDRYFAQKERELDELLDAETGMLSPRFSKRIDCPACDSGSHTQLFVKRGYPIVRCDDCGLVFSNPQVDESLVLDEYREGGSNDLWVDVLTSPRQIELDREKFAEILDELEPHRGAGCLLDVGTSIGLFLRLALDRGWTGIGTEFGRRALAHARDELGLDVTDSPLEQLAGAYDVVTVLSVLEHVNRPREFLREVSRLLKPRGAAYFIVPNVDSLACRVLHERAATFDGRNHLVYFSPRTLRNVLGREGFDVVSTRTRVASLDPILEWVGYEEPYTDAVPDADPLVAAVRERRADIERLLEELDLGYKLHCLAVKRA
jgi:2-polyprenyl-3-methyl-5-hydroxy-6-metoxy-1,4-benzoquinol methylase/Zn ribbon nucleic-acid-binding protein